MAWPGPSNRYNFDPQFDPRYHGLTDSDEDYPEAYPFRDTRPLHWRYPELAERYPDRGQNQYERTSRMGLQAAHVTEANGSRSISSTRCRYEEKDLESNQPRGPGAMLGMKNGQMRILKIRPEDRIIKFTILKPKNFKTTHRFLGVFNIVPTVLYETGDTQGYLMLQETYYAEMEVSTMKTNPMLRRGLGRIKFEAVKGEEALEIARKFASSSKE